MFFTLPTAPNTCRDNRAVDYALKQAGLPVIPTAGFAGESSWEWCFDGLPLNSTVAVTTNCLGRDRETHRLFVGGINAMVKKIHPTAIVVCGKVPAWLPKRHPDIQIIHIPSYSEMWHEREKRKLSGKGILKGGYGGESGKAKRKEDGFYKDSHNFKVTEKSSIIAAEYYIDWGMYVVFLHKSEIEREGRPDLLVDYELLVEVKGVQSLNPSQIAKQIKHASKQISDELARRPEDKQLPGKIVLISFHESFEIGFQLINAGYQEAKRKNHVHFQVELWFNGEISHFGVGGIVMAVWGCGFCGFQIRYHGEPEGKYPVEHTFCMIDNWREFEKENIDVSWLEWENEEKFFYAWRCARCGTFMFFDCKLKHIGTYTPKDEFSSEPMREPFEFGPFWNDFQWFDITENSTPASEVLAKYPDNLWFAKNDDELRFYTDEARTNCVAQFRRIEIVLPVTVATMSLTSFKKMLAHWDDVEFHYHGVYYNFMREDDGINIYRGHGYVYACYHAATFDVDEIVNAKIFPDGKSIVEAQAEIEL